MSQAVPVTTGNQVIELHDLSPNGEWIVFDSDIRGGHDIHKRRLDGGPAELVAEAGGQAFAPAWSPDGTEIVFYSAGSGTRGSAVFVVQADGGTPTQLTDLAIAEHPLWSPDGLTIAFHSPGPDRDGPYRVWAVSRDSVGLPWGEPIQLTDFSGWLYDWAPDNRGVLCDAHPELALVSRSGEVLERYDPLTAGLTGFQSARFSRDGSRIYFVGTQEDGSKGVWWVPSEGGDASKVVAFDDPSLSVYDIFWRPPLTVGAEDLYLTFSDYDSDIWVMDLEW